MEQVIYEAGPVKITSGQINTAGGCFPISCIRGVHIRPSRRRLYGEFACAAAVVSATYPAVLDHWLLLSAAIGIAAVVAQAKLVIRTTVGDRTALTAKTPKALYPALAAIRQAASLQE